MPNNKTSSELSELYEVFDAYLYIKDRLKPGVDSTDPNEAYKACMDLFQIDRLLSVETDKGAISFSKIELLDLIHQVMINHCNEIIETEKGKTSKDQVKDYTGDAEDMINFLNNAKRTLSKLFNATSLESSDGQENNGNILEDSAVKRLYWTMHSRETSKFTGQTLDKLKIGLLDDLDNSNDAQSQHAACLTILLGDWHHPLAINENSKELATHNYHEFKLKLNVALNYLNSDSNQDKDNFYLKSRFENMLRTVDKAYDTLANKYHFRAFEQSIRKEESLAIPPQPLYDATNVRDTTTTKSYDL
ncbi:hypothetical protein L3V82_04855 [Thiotrichales bacterium 19S3-7]|nr:hypothetical protein [Thiotrichales bacterium 19S3-7]MCF6801422.1 hypothetical protein [Thiotrichales bacterium 19S3-11]